jgi:Skp family chaperone for outer membrane proteins
MQPLPVALRVGNNPAEISGIRILVRSLKHSMNRTLALATALATGLVASSLVAQTAPAAAPAAPAAAAPTPQALPTKVAIIAFQQAVAATNEFQRSLGDVQKKYEPKKNALDVQSKEVDSLKQQLQALPSTATDEARAKLIKDADTKEKSLQRDAEDAQNAYNSDLQEAFGKVAQKVGASAVKYCQDNGFTLMLSTGGQQGTDPILWFDASKMDITQAVVNAYNVASGVAAPAPSAPTPARRPTPAATTPKK